MFASPNFHLGYQLAILPLSVPCWRSTSTPHHVGRRKRSSAVAANGDIISRSFVDVTRQLNISPPTLRETLPPASVAPVLLKHQQQQRRRWSAPRNASCSVWNESFVSTMSFADNKVLGTSAAAAAAAGGVAGQHSFTILSFVGGRRNTFLKSCGSLQYAATGTMYGPPHHQIRAFKTGRSSRPETLRRTPASLTDRLKNMVLLSDETPLASSKFQAKSSAFLEGDTSDAHLTEKEKVRVKLAFAEGYSAGKKSSPKGLRALKLIQNLVLLVLIVVVTGTIMASASGTVFKLQINSQVEVDAQDIDITFDDVKGVDEAKQELKEIVEFLKNPSKFSALGGKLPKGALLVGPPGTGKTLLARAVAGEAGVPFFHAAGSEFDEVLVGQGARRIRDLFAAAKNRAPCVIFIDEIDAVGGKRTNSVLHPYANQTINQLLSEMDGFHQNEGVIVLGATNRREDLDKALLRPGRFDVEVHVSVPDYGGRKEIFELYLKKIQCRDIDVDVLARGTIGFTGADIENMVNLAAIKAAVDNAKFVSMKDLENARDKVLMGPARKSRIPDEEANEITAYHEGGHAIVAYFTKDSNPIHKVTIIPRGPSLGHTAYIPKKDQYHTRKSELLASMDTMMGGRAAEELIYGPDRITSGAANDLKQATALATHMVKEWGMSEKVGLRTHDNRDGGALVNVNDLSPGTVELIDQEIKKILQDSYDRAKAILKAHAKEHKLLAEALLKYETLEADDVKAIMNPRKDTM